MTREESKNILKVEYLGDTAAMREAKNAAIETFDDLEALNAINLDLADENEDLVERIGKLIGYIDFLRNTAQGKTKSLNLLEKVVKGQIKEIRTEGENFVKPRTGEWIPLIRREPTEEEKAEYLTQNGEELCYMLENEMPLNGQEVLVSIGNLVVEDVFDEDFYNFENNDIENVDAWMPLPKPYGLESED